MLLPLTVSSVCASLLSVLLGCYNIVLFLWVDKIMSFIFIIVVNDYVDGNTRHVGGSDSVRFIGNTSH